MVRRGFSILDSSILLAILALDMAVLRSLLRAQPGSTNTHLYLVPIDATHSLLFATFALGVLPMASLLVPATIAQAMSTRRSGVASACSVGFTTFGWLSVFLFMSVASLSPPGIQSYLLAISGVFSPAIHAVIGDNPASWLVEAIEYVFVVAVFFLPELAFALFGRWLIGRSGDHAVERPICEGKGPASSFGFVASDADPGVPADPLRVPLNLAIASKAAQSISSATMSCRQPSRGSSTNQVDRGARIRIAVAGRRCRGCRETDGLGE
jgi:hypothetical protein